jgi:hypothetical protein
VPATATATTASTLSTRFLCTKASPLVRRPREPTFVSVRLLDT